MPTQNIQKILIVLFVAIAVAAGALFIVRETLRNGLGTMQGIVLPPPPSPCNNDGICQEYENCGASPNPCPDCTGLLTCMQMMLPPNCTNTVGGSCGGTVQCCGVGNVASSIFQQCCAGKYCNAGTCLSMGPCPGSYAQCTSVATNPSYCGNVGDTCGTAMNCCNGSALTNIPKPCCTGLGLVTCNMGTCALPIAISSSSSSSSAASASSVCNYDSNCTSNEVCATCSDCYNEQADCLGGYICLAGICTWNTSSAMSVASSSFGTTVYCCSQSCNPSPLSACTATETYYLLQSNCVGSCTTASSMPSTVYCCSHGCGGSPAFMCNSTETKYTTQAACLAPGACKYCCSTNCTPSTPTQCLSGESGYATQAACAAVGACKYCCDLSASPPVSCQLREPAQCSGTQWNLLTSCTTSCTSPPPPVETNCADNFDNDGDGFADCADILDCPSGTSCSVPGFFGMQCNGIGNCVCPFGSSFIETICNDAYDNDCDGLYNCADPDCASSIFCPGPSIEICDEPPPYADEDSNGLKNCDDTAACPAGTACRLGPDITEMGFCTASAQCCVAVESSPATCTNGIDDDCDGLVDCSDSSCITTPACCHTAGQSCMISSDCCTGLSCVGPIGSRTCQGVPVIGPAAPVLPVPAAFGPASDALRGAEGAAVGAETTNGAGGRISGSSPSSHWFSAYPLFGGGNAAGNGGAFGWAGTDGGAGALPIPNTTTIPEIAEEGIGISPSAESSPFTPPSAANPPQSESPCASSALCLAVGGTWSPTPGVCGCQFASLTVDIQGSPNVSENGTVRYTVTVRNTGTTPAESVTLVNVDPLTQGLRLAPGGSSPACAGGVCSFGNIPVGGSRTESFSFYLMPGQCAPVANSATVDARNGPVVDSPSIVTTVTCADTAPTGPLPPVSPSNQPVLLGSPYVLPSPPAPTVTVAPTAPTFYYGDGQAVPVPLSPIPVSTAPVVGGMCRENACENGGNDFCTAMGKTCRPLEGFPCLECVGLQNRR